MVLNAVNISKEFNQVKVIEDFDFTIKAKEIVTLIGKSGTGKTTLMRLLNGLEETDQGSISIAGNYLCKSSTAGKAEYTTKKERAAYRKQIGMVFQDYQLFPNLTIIENCIEAPVGQKIISKNEAIDKAESLFLQMGLADKKDVYPRTLSGGQQQRVAIARAMMLNPKILCFDEPTSALDRESASDIGKMIQEIAAADTGILIVTHDREFAKEFGTRMVSSDTFIHPSPKKKKG